MFVFLQFTACLIPGILFVATRMFLEPPSEVTFGQFGYLSSVKSRGKGIEMNMNLCSKFEMVNFKKCPQFVRYIKVGIWGQIRPGWAYYYSGNCFC